jgi:SAM-dependent methyltransferase
MPTCAQCEGIESQFGRKKAEKELRRFRRRGPIPSTQRLIDDLRAAGIANASLLDIGGGVGAIHHELLDGGASSAVHVDVSADYIQVSRDEVARREHVDRVQFVRGDFVQLASGLPDADIVTLDRVICCYPDMQALVGCAADKARRLLAAVYPPDVWWVRLGVRLSNLLSRIRRSEFRAYVHSPAAIDAALRQHGLVRIKRQRTTAWEIVIYARRDAG